MAGLLAFPFVQRMCLCEEGHADEAYNSSHPMLGKCSHNVLFKTMSRFMEQFRQGYITLKCKCVAVSCWGSYLVSHSVRQGYMYYVMLIDQFQMCITSSYLWFYGVWPKCLQPIKSPGNEAFLQRPKKNICTVKLLAETPTLLQTSVVCVRKQLAWTSILTHLFCSISLIFVVSS